MNVLNKIESKNKLTYKALNKDKRLFNVASTEESKEIFSPSSVFLNYFHHHYFL
jgi:hypothetical protein